MEAKVHKDPLLGHLSPLSDPILSEFNSVNIITPYPFVYARNKVLYRGDEGYEIMQLRVTIATTLTGCKNGSCAAGHERDRSFQFGVLCLFREY
jgi:hypothetical protein